MTAALPELETLAQVLHDRSLRYPRDLESHTNLAALVSRVEARELTLESAILHLYVLREQSEERFEEHEALEIVGAVGNRVTHLLSRSLVGTGKDRSPFIAEIIRRSKERFAAYTGRPYLDADTRFPSVMVSHIDDVGRGLFGTYARTIAACAPDLEDPQVLFLWVDTLRRMELWLKFLDPILEVMESIDLRTS